MEWISSKVKCDLCTHNWIAVFPYNCEKLECPNCRNMVNYEFINEQEGNQTAQ
jgi:hypothetical protein